ncbi:MAG: transcriptional regulator, partial [Oscillospiraceae bacterium]|nr:transcriptional regulator [Oscillospiraceae bacterium]
LYEYAFEKEQNYSSLMLVKQRNYSVEDTAISVSDIQNILNSVQVVEEPNIPFPQADKFERVINLCELVSEHHGLSRSDVMKRYDFDSRQTNYYTGAACYLGLLEKETEKRTPVYSISTTGRKILKLNYKQRQLALCSCILSHGAFHKTLQLYFRCGVMPSTNDVVTVMKESGLYRVKSDETFSRRASSIKGWVNWIVSLINE